jgi:hypothetical protein
MRPKPMQLGSGPSEMVEPGVRDPQALGINWRGGA